MIVYIAPGGTELTEITPGWLQQNILLKIKNAFKNIS
jgi:hypothetical protein